MSSVLLPAQEPELVYFAGPGRAELTRSVFNQGKVAFKDTRLQMPEWPAVKNDPASKPAQCFGSIPIIAIGDQLLAQSIALAQYAADLGIYKTKPPTAQQRSLDMMVAGAHADLQAAMYACMFGSDEVKAKGKEDLLGKVTPLLGGLESMYSNTGPYLYGAAPTLGDLAVANAVASPFPGLKALGVDMGPYPKLEACVAAVAEGTTSEGKPCTGAEGELELMYFDGPGRGELTRLALHAGGVAFKDTRIAMGPDWQAIKSDPTSVPAKCFGSVPVIRHGKHVAAQSISLAQYAADLGINKAEPPTPYQRGLDMMVCGAHADLQAAMYKCLFGTEESKTKEREGLAEKVKPTLDGLERFYKGDSSPFLYSTEANGPTLGDLAVLNVVTSPFPGLTALKVDLDAYPNLNKCVAACQASTARPGLKAYLSK